jgi:hypothetical protein
VLQAGEVSATFDAAQFGTVVVRLTIVALSTVPLFPVP